MRRISWIGLAGAIVFLVGYFILSAVPGGGDVDAADFQEFYVTDDRTGMAIVALFLVTLGALGLLWFLWELRGGIGTSLSELGFVSGALGLALIVGGAALLEAPSREHRRSATLSLLESPWPTRWRKLAGPQSS